MMTTKTTNKITKNEKAPLANNFITNLFSTRSQLYRNLFGDGNTVKKDINKECGYPETIGIDDYKEIYNRSGIAKRAVKLLPDETWSILPTIYETEDNNDITEFEMTWEKIVDDKNVFHYLNRIDILSGIGEFGVLLIGIDDGQELSNPVNGINEITGQRVGNNNYNLLYLKPYDQSAVRIKTKENNIKSPRYGYPTMYEIAMESNDARVSKSVIVHWTRVIHIADNRESSEVFGIPRLQIVYNRILDLIKILGGSGEMFWKGGFPGLSFESENIPGGGNVDLNSVKDEVESYMMGLQRYLATENMTVKSLSPQVASPKEHIEANLKEIAISLGVPYRIFFGSEESKLASSQDAKTWNKRVSYRQLSYVNPFIIRPFIDRLISFGVLPEVDKYFIDWPDLNAPTDHDIADGARIKTEALSKYVASGVDSLIPPIQYLTLILGMSQEEAKTIVKSSNLYISEEEIKEDSDE
jgi:hypothetical protein